MLLRNALVELDNGDLVPAGSLQRGDLCTSHSGAPGVVSRVETYTHSGVVYHLRTEAREITLTEGHNVLVAKDLDKGKLALHGDAHRTWVSAGSVSEGDYLCYPKHGRYTSSDEEFVDGDLFEYHEVLHVVQGYERDEVMTDVSVGGSKSFIAEGIIVKGG